MHNGHGVQASCDPLAKSLTKKSKKWAQESKMWELKFNFDLSPASFRMNSVIKCSCCTVVTVHFAFNPSLIDYLSLEWESTFVFFRKSVQEALNFESNNPRHIKKSHYLFYSRRYHFHRTVHWDRDLTTLLKRNLKQWERCCPQHQAW